MLVSENKVTLESVTVKMKQGKQTEIVHVYGASIADLLKLLHEKADGNWANGATEPVEPVESTEEKPKRKRRTKAEMEAEKAKGESNG